MIALSRDEPPTSAGQDADVQDDITAGARPGRRHRRRWVLGAAVGLPVVIAGGAVLAHRIVTPHEELRTVIPATLTVDAAAQGHWQLGSLAVRLTDRQLTITEADLTVWSSTPQEAFLTAGRGQVEWQEDRGYFWPRIEVTEEFASQLIIDARTDSSSMILAGRLVGTPRAIPYTLTITAGPAGGAVVEVDTDDGVDVIGWHSGRSEHAGVHGFGGQFTTFDRDGSLVPIVVREQGVGRGLQPLSFLADLTNHGAGGTRDMSYAAAATFVTTDLRGVRLDPTLPESHAFTVADMRTPTRVGLEVWASRIRVQLTSAATPASLVAAQQAGVTRPALAPWSQQGAIIGVQGGTETVRRRVAELEAAGTEISAVWLQDWTGQRTTSFGERLWWTWQLDRDRYPGWEDLVGELSARGIRTTTYVNPFLTDARDKPGRAVRNLWAEARDAGFLVRTPNGEAYLLDQGGFSASLVDLSNTLARRWFAEVIAENVLAAGVDGFMADFAEGLPFDAVLANGEARLLHNAWPLLWARTVREAGELAGKPEALTWFRSSSLGMAGESALAWTGDQLVDFGPEDGLASALQATFSSGVSGTPLTHSDIGGYTSINAVVHDYVRTPELLQRWTEFAAFGVVMRTHEGNRPTANAQVYDTDQSRAAFARMSRVFTALAPYRKQVLDEARRNGVPALRHGWLVSPGTAAAAVDTQFLLGDAVLVAPVLRAGAASVEVTFPPGRWIHLLTGDTHDGDRVVTVAAPLGTPAAFVRADDPRALSLRQAIRAGLP